MPQQHGVVDLSLSEPGLLVSGGEDFDGDTLSLPLTPPHFTVTALTWQAKTRGGTSKRVQKKKRNETNPEGCVLLGFLTLALPNLLVY